VRDEENIDTTTSGGKLVFHIFGALAEFERDIIRERTQAGLQAARVRGRKGGRPKLLSPKKAQMARELYENKNNSINGCLSALVKGRTSVFLGGYGEIFLGNWMGDAGFRLHRDDTLRRASRCGAGL
jgi:Resolvase, N terminal domain